jgi:hypothetical protein
MNKIVLLFLIGFLAFGFSGCAKKLPEVKTGPEVSLEQIIQIGKEESSFFSRGLYFGAQSYKTVDIENIKKEFYPQWRSVLFNEWSVTRWNERFQCNAFAIKFVGDVNARFYVDNWHSFSKVESPAVGFCYYLVNGEKEKPHAVVWMIGMDKKIYGLEPQTGEVFRFTEKELNTMWLKSI